MQFFNKTSAGFVVRFVVMLTLAFSILWGIDWYVTQDIEENVSVGAVGEAEAK